MRYQMQTIKLYVKDSFNTINAKLAEIDFTKDYKVELDDWPIAFSKVVVNGLYQVTRNPEDPIWPRQWLFSSEYINDKEILLDLFESWRVHTRYEYIDM